MAPALEGKSIGSNQKTVLKGELLILENQESGWGPKCGPTQGFNLLQIRPNWFLGNRTLEPCLKWSLIQLHFIAVPTKLLLTIFWPVHLVSFWSWQQWKCRRNNLFLTRIHIARTVFFFNNFCKFLTEKLGFFWKMFLSGVNSTIFLIFEEKFYLLYQFYFIILKIPDCNMLFFWCEYPKHVYCLHYKVFVVNIVAFWNSLSLYCLSHQPRNKQALF